MSEAVVIQNSGEFLCFAVFDPTTKKLLYSKYNFDFDKYKTENNLSTTNKNALFHNFLVNNETNLWKPFSVKEDLKKYFLSITQEIQDYFDDINYIPWGFNFNALPSYANYAKMMTNEFNLYYYDYFNELPVICEFLHKENNKFYTKYNFNFSKYSSDFNIYGSKMSIFNDLLLRLEYLCDNTPGFIGFNGIPDLFKTYFHTDETSKNSLETYLENYSVYSVYNNVEKSFTKINFTNYSELIKNNYGIIFNNETESKKYFLKYGQFQQDIINFILSQDTEIVTLSKSVCSVITSNGFGTGFLFRGSVLHDVVNGVQQIYLLTCYHIIENSHKNTLYVTCYYDEENDIKLLFRIIAYDRNTDICIAMYDDTLDYNKNFFPEETWNIRKTLSLLNIVGDGVDYLGQQLITIGNPSLTDNLSYLEGKIMDTNYSGSFDRSYILSYPPTILSDMHISVGQSGSPLFVRDPKDNLLKCIGMLNAKLGDDYQFSMGINNNLLRRVVTNGISYWFRILRRYNVNDIEEISFNIQEIFPKKWLGANFVYYNPLNPKNNKAFSNFTLNGGIMLTKFVLGFNIIKKRFIYNYDELSEQGVKKIDTPLLKSKLYQKYIYNNRIPVVIKSMKLYDYINGVYKKFNLGKYKNQYGMDIFTYGFMQSGTQVNASIYTNTQLRKYSTIELEYYYYNGKNWILDKEEIGGNDDSWFNIYSDEYGHLFKQHKWEFPAIVLPYLTSFTKSAGYTDATQDGMQDGMQDGKALLCTQDGKALLCTQDGKALQSSRRAMNRPKNTWGGYIPPWMWSMDDGYIYDMYGSDNDNQGSYSYY